MARELEEEKQLQNMEDLQIEIAALKDREEVMSLPHYEVIIVGFSLILLSSIYVGTARKVSPNWSQETMTCHSSNCCSVVWGQENAPLVTSLPSSCHSL